MIDENLIKADGFDDAIVGIGRRKGSEDGIVYNYDKCVEILVERDDMDYEEAIEFMEYNIVDAYVGPSSPIFVKLGEEFEYCLKRQFRYEGQGIVGCVVVQDLEQPSEIHGFFSSIVFKSKNVPQDICSHTEYKKLRLVVDHPNKESWVFSDARIGIAKDSTFADPKYVLVYRNFCKD